MLLNLIINFCKFNKPDNAYHKDFVVCQISCGRVYGVLCK